MPGMFTDSFSATREAVPRICARRFNSRPASLRMAPAVIA
jgi:hypothetical protein